MFDLHIHSKFSIDSILEPQKIIKIARKRGLNGVAITDHNIIKGGVEAKKYCDKGFFVLIGSEVKTEIGDLSGLFLNDEIKSQNSLEVIDEIKDQGGLVILPHPFRAHNWEKIDKRFLKKIDIIEGFNARCSAKKNERAQTFAKKEKIPMIGGSDAHFSMEIGRGKTIINYVDDEENIKKAIMDGKTEIIGKELLPCFRGLSVIVKIAKTIKYREAE